MKTSNVCIIYIFLILSLFLFLLSCSQTKVIRKLEDPYQINTDSIRKSSEILKVHTNDGSLYLLTAFYILPHNDTIFGQGEYYNPNRKKISSFPLNKDLLNKGLQSFKIPLSGIAIVETNTIKGINGKLLTMGLVGVPTAITSIYCLINPKACFGSCPTFYAWNGNEMKLMAEGFSSSILRTFEKDDIDMLYWSKTNGNDFHLKLTNEALETHIIRYADLLVFPKKGEERVFATEDGKFFKTENIIAPVVCKGPEGDCRNLVLKMDAKERYSGADSKNIANHEFIDLEFNNTSNSQKGLLIGARQTLLTTYLFYQGIAYTGNANGYFAARIESGDKTLKRRVERMWDLLGGIEIFLKDSHGEWIKTGEIEEMGPIASDVHLIKLPPQKSDHINIRLRMTKGLWRIDYIGLTETTVPVQPIRINPSIVTTNDTVNCNAMAQLCDTIEPLITLPGDSHVLHYTLPGISDDYEVFLNSKGYYLEWMREEWMAEKDIKKAYLMFGMPKLYLNLIAEKFKVVEPSMEETFWRSRYVKN